MAASVISIAAQYWSCAWVTTAQSTFGVSIAQIQSQMAGGPRPTHPETGAVLAQAELFGLWTYNPEGLPDGSPANKMQGLGGGITWAWDPTLCDDLMPLFREGAVVVPNLVNCDDVKASVERAFGKWSANNRYVDFVDVTSECAKLGVWSGAPEPKSGAPSGFAQNPALRYHGGCPLAEIWVTRRVVSEAAQSGDIAVATAYTYWRYSTNFFFTNGEQPFTLDPTTGVQSPRQFIEAYAGTMRIAVNGTVGGAPLCWYLDSFFCSGFHRFKASLGSASGSRMLLTMICWGVSVAALLWLLLLKMHAVRACFGIQSAGKRQADRDNDGDLELDERWLAFMEEVAEWNPLGFAFLITLIIAPPTVLHYTILPCWDCADFEAAILHEAGHFLGLGHPDNIPNNLRSDAPNLNPLAEPQNSYQAMLASGGRTNESNCRTLWQGVASGTPPGLDASLLEEGTQGYLLRDSVMEAFTQHNPRPCLTDDDVEALAVLYPDCSHASLSANVCHKVNLSIGLVRLAAYVLTPLLIALFCIILFSSVVHRYQREELQEARSAARQAKRQAQMRKRGGQRGGRTATHPLANREVQLSHTPDREAAAMPIPPTLSSVGSPSVVSSSFHL